MHKLKKEQEAVAKEARRLAEKMKKEEEAAAKEARRLQGRD